MNLPFWGSVLLQRDLEALVERKILGAQIHQGSEATIIGTSMKDDLSESLDYLLDCIEDNSDDMPEDYYFDIRSRYIEGYGEVELGIGEDAAQLIENGDNPHVIEALVALGFNPSPAIPRA